MANAALVARRTVLAVVASACLVGPARSPGPSHTRTARARRDVDPWSISRVDSPTSSVALTFDDGPDPDYTPDVLRILAAAQVHATFFVIGRNAREYPELIAAILDGGHEIGNHTQDHVWLDGVPPVEVRRQLVEGSRSIAGAAATWRPDGAIGHGASRHDDGSLPAPNPKDTPWLRPPHGWTSPAVANEAHALGQRSIFWDGCLDSYLSQTPPEAARRTARAARGGSILLCHDGGSLTGPNPQHLSRANTVAALPHLLDGLAARGLSPVTVTGLLEAAG